MAIDPIGIPQVYGCPLYENSSVEEAQMVFILENTCDPNQVLRSAKSLLALGTQKGDIILLQAPKLQDYDCPVITELHDLTRQYYGLLDFDHDPKYRSWDLDQAYSEAKTNTQDVNDLSYLFHTRLMMRDINIMSPTSSEEERYRTALRTVFAYRDDAASEEDRVINVLKQGSSQEVLQTKRMLDQEINRCKKDKLAETLSKYFPQRQDSLMQTIQEHLGRRKIYVLCGREHAYINPATKTPYSSEVERLIKFLQEKQFKFAIVDASCEECIKPDSGRLSEHEQPL